MNKWAAFLLAVVVLVLDKHIMAWISLKKAKSAEKTAEHELEKAEAEKRKAELYKAEAEVKQLTAQLQNRTAERIAVMSTEQAEAYQKTIAPKCENCIYAKNFLPMQSISQQLPMFRLW